MYEIDVETQPEDGTIKGLRIRRSGEANEYKNLEDDDENYNIPEIDIQRVGDGSIKINGIRIKRNDLNDLSDVDLDGEATDGEGASDRTRRSGGDLLGFIGHKLQQKLSLLASSSSGHNAESDLHYGAPVTSYNMKAFDIWAFKKAILNTLLQAVKAIKGGVIALGGQIIKAKGHLISTKGSIIATKGEALSDFGRHIAANALLNPSPAAIASTGPATAFGQAAIDHDAGYPAAISSGYAAPVSQHYHAPAISTSYGAPQHGYAKRGATNQQYGVPQELPNGVQAGLLVLKPINVAEDPHQSAYGKRKINQFASRDSQSAQSEVNPVEVQREAEERSYYLHY